MTAHVAGIPLEETAFALAPVAAGLLAAGAGAGARMRKTLRARLGLRIGGEAR